MKRVVTGHDGNGKSIIIMDGEPPRTTEFKNFPGLRFKELWATDAGPHIASSGEDPTKSLQHFIAPVGGTRFRICHFPPDAILAELLSKGDTTLEEFGAEFASRMPDLAGTLEREHLGMHTTNTIDYNVVLDGEIWCELDDGVEIHLSAGDVLVQCGTRHAWRNKGTQGCVLASIMVGATR